MQITKTLVAVVALVGILAGCATARHPSGVSNVEEAMARNMPIFITELKTTRPYQGGFVDVSIAYTNISTKTVHSVRFTLVARDATGASLPSETNNRFEATLEDSAATEPGSRHSNRWTAVWKNRGIVCSEILETDVQFTDGTTAVSYADSSRRACR